MEILNFYLQKSLSRTKWRKQPLTKLRWWVEVKRPDGTTRRDYRDSDPLSLELLEKRLSAGETDFSQLNLFSLQCRWLDHAVSAGPQFHAVGSDGTSLKFRIQPNYGPNFPYVPVLDREGFAFTSFQIMVIRRLVSLRRDVVTSSSQFTSENWFQLLRSLISECVSVVDMTLHQLYFKAECDPLPGWKFEPEKLGPRHGRRLVDKLKWVHAITGEHLNAPGPVSALTRVKAVRNHLQHFDPPVFCYTLEDVVSWLNDVLDVGRLLRSIRSAVGSPLCEPLVDLLLEPTAVFVPSDPDRRRIPQGPGIGYASSVVPVRTSPSSDDGDGHSA